MKKLFGKGKPSAYSTKPTPFAVDEHSDNPSPPHSPRPPPSKPSNTAVGALGILRSLDPTAPVEPFPVPSPQDKRTAKKSQPPPPPPLPQEEGELTRMIGYLTATASDDWALLLQVCERASASEQNAKEAVRALRREFKYGAPQGQLAATRLFALFLKNTSSGVVSQLTSRKFLDTIEELVLSPRAHPVVKERIIDVIAAAAYASQSSKRDKDGFRGLWKKVKPPDMPDQGVPFSPSDTLIFNAQTQQQPQSQPQQPRRPSYELQQPPNPLPLGVDDPPPPSHRTHHHHHLPSPHSPRNRIIPPDEDIRRLHQECKIALGNASLLESALAHSDIHSTEQDPIVKEFLLKCRTSQELIYAQIPWASAQAEKSRIARDADIQKQLTDPVSFMDDPSEKTVEENLLEAILQANESLVEVLKQHDDVQRLRLEEQNKKTLSKKQNLYANGNTRDPTPSPPNNNPYLHPQQHHQQPRSPSPSISSDISQYQQAYHQPHAQQQQQYYPPQRPFGPRSVPAPLGPRPSVETERDIALVQPPHPSLPPSLSGATAGVPRTTSTVDGYIWVPPPHHHHHGRRSKSTLDSDEDSPPPPHSEPSSEDDVVEEVETEEEEEYSANPPAFPSEKARGKMKAVEHDRHYHGELGVGEDDNGHHNSRTNGYPYPPPQNGGGGVYLNGHPPNQRYSFESIPPPLSHRSSFSSSRLSDDDRDNNDNSGDGEDRSGRGRGRSKKVEYVYDAAAERTRERLRAMGLERT